MLSQIGGKHLPELHELMGTPAPENDQSADAMVAALNRWAAAHNAATEQTEDFDPSAPINQPNEAEQQCQD